MPWKPCALLVVGLALACPAPPTQPVASTELGGEAFASRWRVVVPEAVNEATKASIQTEVEAALRAVEQRLSAWKKDSEVVRCHDLGAGLPCPVSRETARVVKTCLDVTRATGGAFDITVAPLLDLWGISASTRGRVHERPSAAAIADALRRVDSSAIAVTEGEHPAIVRTRDDVRLDVTAVTDGAAADAVARALWARGARHFLVDVAGEVAVAGNAEGRPGGRAWRVGISDARGHQGERPGEHDVAALTVAVDATDGLRALSTSGTTRDTREVGGSTVSHILDPRTGEPVRNEVVSCTVVGTDAVVADALSTACIVLGRTEMEAMLSRVPGVRGSSALYGFADGRFEPGGGFPRSAMQTSLSSESIRMAASVVSD